MQEIIGLVEVGKPSGMMALNIYAPRKTPLITSGQYMELQQNLVRAAQGGDLVMAMVDGDVLFCRGP